MSVYNPGKKSLPSWMMMNEQTSKHWMNSLDVDMEISGKDAGMTEATIADGISYIEILRLRGSCSLDDNWELNNLSQKESRACDTVAMKYPEVNLRHVPCYRSIRRASMGGGGGDESYRGCNMYSSINGKLYPEYAKCLKPGGMDDLDCQRVCYTYPNQKGCETLTAGLDRSQLVKKLREIGKGPKPEDLPAPTPPAPKPPAPKPPAPVPEETVVIAASMKSVTPTAVQFAYVDPKTKKSVVVKKTLVDMYKPTDKVTVVLGKKTNKFVGLQKK
jgi:hypothetical protein